MGFFFKKKTRIYKTKKFDKWSRKERINDGELRGAVDEMNRGLIDADLGSNIFKKRIAASGRGKRGGARTILAYKLNDKAFFIFGFTKSDQGNVSSEDMKPLKELSKRLLDYNDREIKDALRSGAIMEV